MDELTPALVVTLVGGVLALVQAARYSRREASFMLTSFLAHILSALAQVRVTRDLYGGIGDMLSYTRYGAMLGRILGLDFYRFAPELIHLAIGPRANIPVAARWAGSSTGAMMALGGFLSYFTGGGPNTLCLTVAIWAYFGQVALYLAFRTAFPEEAFRQRLLFATLLVPSCVFWSSGLLKEAVAIGGVGFAVLGFVRIRKAFRFDPVMQIGAGAFAVGLVKAYILFALILGAGAWLYCERERGRARASTPVKFVLGAVVAVGGIAILSSVFPQFAVSSLAERAAAYQGNTEAVEGASNYAIGNTSETTLTGQLPYIPLALITAFFRPFLFEARSPQAVISAVETAVFLLVTIRALKRRSLRDTWAMLSRTPLLAFCLMFSLSLGLGVGITTTNMGTLSRYRMPLIPFFVALILILDAPVLGRERSPVSGAAGPVLLRRRLH